VSTQEPPHALLRVVVSTRHWNEMLTDASATFASLSKNLAVNLR
jgi:hypothetical protein